MLRRRRSTLKSVKELDAFPKVPESYTEYSSTGGTISIVCFIIIIFLVISEILHYQHSEYKFNYGVDTELDSKLKINVDLTIAMPCSAIGADVLDVTNQNVQTYGSLEENEGFYELNNEQKLIWEQQRNINHYIRKEYHSLQELIWRSGVPKVNYQINNVEDDFNYPNACNLKGSLTVNKVSGNFHITAGKLLPGLGIHAHLSMFLRDSDFNFSHRINSFSFGDQIDELFNPLDGDEKVADENSMVYTYFIKVVPTEVHTKKKKIKTFQYSVTEQTRSISHHKGSHGVPGIYFKYDMSSIKVKITENWQPLWQLLIRLCAIVGGVFTTSGIINSIISLIAENFIQGKKNLKSSSSNDSSLTRSASETTNTSAECDNDVFTDLKSTSSTTSCSNKNPFSLSSLPDVTELDDSAMSVN